MRAQFEREADQESPWTSYNASLGRPLLNTAKFLKPKSSSDGDRSAAPQPLSATIPSNGSSPGTDHSDVGHSKVDHSRPDNSHADHSDTATKENSLTPAAAKTRIRSSRPGHVPRQLDQEVTIRKKFGVNNQEVSRD